MLPTPSPEGHGPLPQRAPPAAAAQPFPADPAQPLTAPAMQAEEARPATGQLSLGPTFIRQPREQSAPDLPRLPPARPAAHRDEAHGPNRGKLTRPQDLLP